MPIEKRRQPAKIVTITSTVALAVALGAVSASAAPPSTTSVSWTGARCSADASLLGFSDSLDKTTFDGLPVAGLSALALTRSSRALALVDNTASVPARVFELGLDRRGSRLSTEVRDVTVLRRPDGQP